MVDKNKANELRDLIQKISGYHEKEMSRRSEWGSINFDEINSDLQTVISLTVSLDKLPIQYLADQTIRDIVEIMKELLPHLKTLDKFNITEGDPNGRRGRLVSDIHHACDRFYSQVGIWLPFLAYQNGDVAENIKRLQAGIAETEREASEGLRRIHEKENEVDEIVVRTREASADAGVAVFTDDFKAESEASAKNAKTWLWAASVLGILTLTVPILAYFCEDYSAMDQGQLISKLASKIVVVSVLFTATMWCGKIYKSLRHLSILNKHRAIGIKTFRAFSAAAADSKTKDAILMETTHSIFANSSTGLINEPNPDTEPNIIQIAGKMLDSANAK